MKSIALWTPTDILPVSRGLATPSLKAKTLNFKANRMTGGAIELAESKDQRALELERRLSDDGDDRSAFKRTLNRG